MAVKRKLSRVTWLLLAVAVATVAGWLLGQRTALALPDCQKCPCKEVLCWEVQQRNFGNRGYQMLNMMMVYVPVESAMMHIYSDNCLFPPYVIDAHDPVRVYTYEANPVCTKTSVLDDVIHKTIISTIGWTGENTTRKKCDDDGSEGGGEG